ncbi:DUF4269 domain-containing protein [Exilibacterium tricleocarpae]|uniref:DUF4269 domain-containing protein n=1 Tax=Exilibacterium tricleocarpae TaxID=2591008 RepID=A0A545TLL2_9GAMM|nr:DUF4269 domain-containing protein [Exilibacterium tricleocarpae]TQV78117.1 DUF4269 domain-containing protein [Exilibacterium tricleocarpae]
MTESNTKVIQARAAIANAKILERLSAFKPEIVSTIFVEFDVEDSDIDIICRYMHKPRFVDTLKSFYGDSEQFSCDIRNDHVLSRFYYQGFLFEIYGSTLPVNEQMAYQHYKVMQRLSKMGGKRFQQQVRHKKRNGFKTEPAIASLLQLSGNPYQAVLALNDHSDIELAGYLKHCV